MILYEQSVIGRLLMLYRKKPLQKQRLFSVGELSILSWPVKKFTGQKGSSTLVIEGLFCHVV